MCTDRENQVVCIFEEHRFNETQKITLLEDVVNPNPLKLARMMREMADWLLENHRDKI